ncbi:FAD-binding oxidoreductase [Flavobacterium sp. CYK-55]|uniref:NAD(P)/FAD-dependent oxidoreductase n=1 Tax=Flavobacterium sp. CYK-55 TaxID=2835529 RepID=UPI001BCAAB12|nr:FAD-binding oxidoreductase [Flavobacterium sp. CYK-55]MBS7785757.1 FAD-binding oxidoreductase [Flavobacterium sp. CYK-55]
MYDFLIIGSGLAGLSFAEIALQNNCSIYVIDDCQQNASYVAGGLYNPIILKRFSKAWQAEKQLPFALQFYRSLEQKLNRSFFHDLPILRRFFSVEEQNNWFVAADKSELSDYLSVNLISDNFNGLSAPFDFGKVNCTGFLEVASLMDSFRAYLKEQKVFSHEVFVHTELQIEKDFLIYKNLKAKHIIFAEGFGMLQNPFFSDLPLVSSKGELLLIKAPELELDQIVNAGIFILPLGDGLFKIGATYNWEDQTSLPTKSGREELLSQLDEIINCCYEVVDHYAGIRPTVNDRRPLVGTHHLYKNIHLLNGLGTRGVLVGPSMANELFQQIVNNEPVQAEANINRIYRKRGVKI